MKRTPARGVKENLKLCTYNRSEGVALVMLDGVPLGE